MSSYSDLGEIAPITIVHEAMVSRDSYGKPTYAAPVSYVGGRRTYKLVRRTNANGAVDFISGSVIWLLATPTMSNEDRIYVQGDTAPFPPILDFNQPADETGQPYYTKIYLGSANG